MKTVIHIVEPFILFSDGSIAMRLPGGEKKDVEPGEISVIRERSPELAERLEELINWYYKSPYTA